MKKRCLKRVRQPLSFSSLPLPALRSACARHASPSPFREAPPGLGDQSRKPGLRSACRPRYPGCGSSESRAGRTSDCGGISSCADIPRRLLPSFLTNDAGIAGRTKGRAGPFSGPARTGESCAFAGGCGIGRDDRASRAVSDRRGGEEPGFVMTTYEKMTRIILRSSADRSARDGEEMESSGNITGRSPSRSTPSLLGGAWCSLWRLGWFSAGIPRCRARGRTIASALRNWRRIWRPPALRGRGLP